eukprot:13994043-Ditylum_brightwellii.AAC.1
MGQFYRFTPSSTVKPNQKQQISATFSAYIKTLPKWEQQLLTHWSYRTLNSMHLKDHIQCKQQFYLVTDSREDNGIGYFGWTIASKTL